MAAMTPGLGNIYDAAALGHSVLWLPEAGLCPLYVEWHDVLPDITPIDYFDEQPKVMQRIADSVTTVLSDPTRHAAKMRACVDRLLGQPHPEKPALRELIAKFGTSGDAKIAAALYSHILVPLHGQRQ
eukprot:CAMPEP_0175988594 /NCGR_PEP_ID=MMETSP0108-20121206/51330_1 /TAXON_ID=195067 ORGANISM="Goniomonas pacifica, Strain CCMP1869" /NCGR_SAMPLE_ID=MMETSP0108 /ASSEMBLY_ACC=CAM_ASM_000204 /LENGTH=127 /DNA_ID=CAMNT_0017319957 /DNA_START=25 /DNA_END=409 /DNA_ORIENTATION=-